MLFWRGSAPVWRQPASMPVAPAAHPVEVTPVRPPEVEASQAPAEPARRPPVPVDIEQVVSSAPAPDEVGETATDESDEDLLPPVRIQWDSPDALRSVAQGLDMRILGVDAEENIIGEVATIGPLEMLPFEGSLGTYSNRVRRIDDRTFFGGEILRAHEETLAGFWVLVPAVLDRQISREVRRAVADVGERIDAVRFVEARFERTEGFPPRFEVLHIARRSR